MARPLQPQEAHHHHHHHHHHLAFTTTTTLLLVVAAIAAVSSVILSLCTNHDKLSKHLSLSSKNYKNKRPDASMTSGTDHRKLANALSDISSKVLVVAKMVSWRKPDSDDDEEEEDADDVVWKKSILMGERCRPLDFSGQIIYDTDGKEVKALPSSRVIERGVSGGGGHDRDETKT